MSVNNQLDVQTTDFIVYLVEAVTGFSIEDFEADQQERLIQETVDTFSDYIEKYVTLKYSKKDASRLLASKVFSDPSVFSKYPDLEIKFNEAYKSFFDNIHYSWKLKQ